MSIPVRLSDRGIPVRAVESGAPTMQVGEIGVPIRITEWGLPFVVLGLGPDTRPDWLRLPSISPTIGTEGDVFTIDPGDGPGLTWTLTLDGVDVKGDVVDGEWVGGAGQLVLTARIEDEVGFRTRTVSVTVAAAEVEPDPEVFAVDGGQIVVMSDDTQDADSTAAYTTDDQTVIVTGV